jgi:hypothetical protein
LEDGEDIIYVENGKRFRGIFDEHELKMEYVHTQRYFGTWWNSLEKA